MKKALFLLISSAIFAWGANCGDLGYGSTAYGASGYGSSPSESNGYGATGYGANGYGATGYCRSDTPEAAPEKKEKPKTQATAKSQTKEESKIKAPSFDLKPAKPYGYRLVVNGSGVLYDVDINGLDWGAGTNIRFFERSGNEIAFIEYGVGLGFVQWSYYNDWYFSADWNLYVADIQAQFGLQLGPVICRFGGYLGALTDNKAEFGYHDDYRLLQHKYHYGVTIDGSFYISHFELGLVFRSDLNEINEDLEATLVSIGLTAGYVF